MHRSFHVLWWENGGGTDIDLLALLCEHHHHQVHRRLRREKREQRGTSALVSEPIEPVDERSEEHHGGWEIAFGEDGHPELIPPPHLDPMQRPRRNTHWQRQRTGPPAPQAA